MESELRQTFLPRMIVLQASGDWCVRYMSEKEVIADNFGEGVFDPRAKIVVENSTTDDNLFHLRFAISNRYWSRGENGYIVANSKEPVEDKLNPSCTLFSIETQEFMGLLYNKIKHVHTGGQCLVTEPGSHIKVTTIVPRIDFYARWFVINWETLVKMPNHVAFKGDNGKYLTGVWAEGHNYLQFSSNDPNDFHSGFQITHLPTGNLRIKSDWFNQFCRRSPNWIWADSGDTGSSNVDTLFWPVKIDDNTIALQNLGNNNFCKPLSVEGKTNCLNAAVSTITREARLVVEELVRDRTVYDVVYQMQYARIHNTQPYVAGSTTATNETDQEANIEVSITYQDEKSYSFTRGISMTAGVTSTIETNLLTIVKASIQVSYSITGTFEWNNTTTTTTSVTATGSVPVPAKSKAILRYVGTKGTCDVPFHYTMQYRRSTDGALVKTNEIDGIYTGINCYDFDFKFENVLAL